MIRLDMAFASYPQWKDFRPLEALPPAQQAIRDRCFHPGGIFVEFAKEEIEQSIPERFERQVALYPGRCAAKSRSERWTYAEINRAANRLAHALLRKAGQAEEPVALLLEHDVSLVAAILGVLKAGKIYMPVQSSYPAARIHGLLEDAQARLIVTNSRNLACAGEAAGGERRLINIDQLDSSLSIENPGLRIAPDAPAYILYTSGSTGEPKGVFQNHRNVLHKVMTYTNDLHLCVEDGIALLSPCAFSLSVGFIFGALLNGACLYPIDPQAEGPNGLRSRLIDDGITVLNAVPSVFRSFGETLTQEDRFPKLRLIHLGGEPATGKDVELYRSRFAPHCILLHNFGSNETGTIAQLYIDPSSSFPDGIVPAGYATGDGRIAILEKTGESAQPGQAGEIAFKSRHLAMGYWGKPELTQTAFLDDAKGKTERVYRTGDLGRISPDGGLIHLGRKDFRVKVRGHRIDVGEIEARLLEYPGVTAAVVASNQDQWGNERLVAYLVLKTGALPAVGELRGFLNKKLPDPMLPSAFVELDALPLLPNGKVNRQALPPPPASRPNLETPFVAPRSPVEEILTGIWSEVLGLERIGVHDNFLDLGGHSLMATQIIARLINRFQVELPVKALLDAPTVAEMALVITQNRAKTADEGDLQRMLAELEGLSAEEARRLLSDKSPKSGE